jgi:adenosine deaminase
MTTAGRVSELLWELPKVDLHCHLDGSLRPRTVLELAQERGVKLPAGTVEELTPHVQVGAACATLEECLNVFKTVYPLLRDAAALERVAYELCEDSASENIRHLEVRYAPMLNAAPGFGPQETVEAVLRGLRRGRQDFGVSSGVILCLFRSHGSKENRAAFETLKRFYRADAGLDSPSVVGMDLAGDEGRFPIREYAEFFEEAAALEIPATCHAGETPGTSNLKDALELGVRRIGHGTQLPTDPDLVAEVAKRRLPIEISLTSNLRTSAVSDLRSHPARELYRRGVRLSFNTDDRGLFGIDLTHEYGLALEAGFTFPELRAIALDSLEQLFLPEHEIAALRGRFVRWTAEVA